MALLRSNYLSDFPHYIGYRDAPALARYFAGQDLAEARIEAGDWLVQGGTNYYARAGGSGDLPWAYRFQDAAADPSRRDQPQGGARLSKLFVVHVYGWPGAEEAQSLVERHRMRLTETVEFESSVIMRYEAPGEP